MFTREVLARAAGVLALCAVAGAAAAQNSGPLPRLGTPLPVDQAAQWNLNVFPDGTGLPPGRGTAIEGRALFVGKCQGCHGEGGQGASAEELIGGATPLNSATPDKTIGTYWPFATTIFDFTRRAMPMDRPGSLTDDEVYALTAYLLFANGIIGERQEVDATSLPRVRMPNRDGFIGIDATPAGAQRPGH